MLDFFSCKYILKHESALLLLCNMVCDRKPFPFLLSKLEAKLLLSHALVAIDKVEKIVFL